MLCGPPCGSRRAELNATLAELEALKVEVGKKKYMKKYKKKKSKKKKSRRRRAEEA